MGDCTILQSPMSISNSGGWIQWSQQKTVRTIHRTEWLCVCDTHCTKWRSQFLASYCITARATLFLGAPIHSRNILEDPELKNAVKAYRLDPEFVAMLTSGVVASIALEK
ncbi:hypothetical protein Tco_0277443, partial [Tanacetum coccineum]